MKILIAYASKSGTARAAAELLATHLKNHEVTVTDLEKNDPVLGDFDYIVLGGPIRMGKAHKALRHRSGGEVAIADADFIAMAHFHKNLDQLRGNNRGNSFQHCICLLTNIRKIHFSAVADSSPPGD